jgi:aerobic-type carbon monoxide dehydrogenase small subunit (CoxS/CutS family)
MADPGTNEAAGQSVVLTVNGVRYAGAVPPGMTLLELLRDRLRLTGTKRGCGRGECGACTVLVAGRSVPSCLTLAVLVSGEVTTVEGLADELCGLRAEFADRGGLQCGFCTSGQLVQAAEVLRHPPGDRQPGAPGEPALRRALNGNLCRCTGYGPIVAAVRAELDR